MGGLWLKAKYLKTQSKLGQAQTIRTCIHEVYVRTAEDTQGPGQVPTLVGTHTALAKFVLQWEDTLPWLS
jgi:hypothetical protein